MYHPCEKIYCEEEVREALEDCQRKRCQWSRDRCRESGGGTCLERGQLAVNGGMEQFSGNIPTGWSANVPCRISRVCLPGRVHSGDFAVNLTDGGMLFQDVTVEAGCFFSLSFFARGEGSQVGVTAMVIFIDAQNQPTEGLAIEVRRQDMGNASRVFSHYQGITTAAPAGTVKARIEFTADAEGNQSMDLDDVSFSAV